MVASRETVILLGRLRLRVPVNLIESVSYSEQEVSDKRNQRSQKTAHNKIYTVE